MTKISSSTKFNEIAAELATLNGVIKISDIVNVILQIIKPLKYIGFNRLVGFILLYNLSIVTNLFILLI